MSVELFSRLLDECDLNAESKLWFPMWVERYAVFLKLSAKDPLEIARESVINYLKSLRDIRVPARQRLQAALAVEFYRDLVLSRDKPNLKDVIHKLKQKTEQEQFQDQRPVVTDTRLTELERAIDPAEPIVIQTLRRECRLLHYSIRTEKAYVGWVERFLTHYSMLNAPSFAAIGERQVKQFLSELATTRRVSASTQNQAFSALLFLFRNVFHRNLESIDAVRAKRPQRLPVVLSRDQTRRILAELSGREKLMAQLLYGAGLRLMECLRMRIKDVAFDLGQLIVREGKGNKDRVTILPQSAKEGLQAQIEIVRQIHERDLIENHGRV